MWLSSRSSCQSVTLTNTANFTRFTVTIDELLVPGGKTVHLLFDSTSCVILVLIFISQNQVVKAKKRKIHLPLNCFFSWSPLFSLFGEQLGQSNLVFFLLGLHLQHQEVPRLGVESELQLLACTTATTTQDPSYSCDLHHSSWQRWILNPLSKARNGTQVLMDAGWVHYHWATMEFWGNLAFTLHFSIAFWVCVQRRLCLLWVTHSVLHLSLTPADIPLSLCRDLVSIRELISPASVGIDLHLAQEPLIYRLLNPFSEVLWRGIFMLCQRFACSEQEIRWRTPSGVCIFFQSFSGLESSCNTIEYLFSMG